jgi:[NiFe] hydrogenase large subunit/hydrogenase large subunit
MASAINLEDTGTINAVRLADVHGMIVRARRFVEQVYWPDLVAIAGFYKDWAAIGGGTGNYLSVGEFADLDSNDLASQYFPRGIILNRDLSKVWEYDQNLVKEYISSAWYEYSTGDDSGLHPYEGNGAEVHRAEDADLPAGGKEIHLMKALR